MSLVMIPHEFAYTNTQTLDDGRHIHTHIWYLGDLYPVCAVEELDCVTPV